MVLTSGILSLISVTNTSASLSSTDASGGTTPYTYQWYKSTSGPSFVPGPSNIISGATDLNIGDFGLSPGMTYFYKVVYTDATSATVESLALAVTTTGQILSAGIISLISAGSNSAQFLATQASGGTAPYSVQWYKSIADPGFIPGPSTLIFGANSLNFKDLNLFPSTKYYYKIVYTDSTNSDSVISSVFTLTTLPASINVNSFNTNPFLGELDLKVGAQNVCTVLIDKSQIEPIFSGQPVKFVNTNTGIPSVVAAGTDMPSGYIAYDAKQQSYSAGNRCEIARNLECIWLYSTEPIIRGSQVVLDDFIASGVKQATGNTNLPIVGEAYDQAIGSGQLVRIILKVPSFELDSPSGGPPSTTNLLENNGDNTITSTVNSVPSTTDIITQVSVYKPDLNDLSISVNNVVGVNSRSNNRNQNSIQIIESLQINRVGSSLTVSANGQTSPTPATIQPPIDSPTSGNLMSMDGTGINQDSGVAVTNSPLSGAANRIPTAQAMQAAIATAISTGSTLQGSWDASGGNFPSTRTDLSPIQKGDYWVISVAGTLPGSQPVVKGDQILALVNTPAQTPANWNIDSSKIQTVFGRSGPDIIAEAGDYDVSKITGAAPTNNPIFTGNVSVPNPSAAADATRKDYVDTGLATKINTSDAEVYNSSGNTPNTIAKRNEFGELQANLANSALSANQIAVTEDSSSTLSYLLFANNPGPSFQSAKANSNFNYNAVTNKILISGVTLSDTPASASDATRKDYVDNGLAGKINATTGNAIQKADGSGGLTDAIPGTDYQPIISPAVLDNFVTQTSSGVVKDSGISLSTSSASNDNSHVPSTAAMQSAISNAITSGSSFRPGGYDASSNLFPSTGGSGSGGAIRAGDYWIITVAGTLGGTPVLPNDSLQSMVNNPGQTSSNWVINGAVTKTYVDDQLALKAPLNNPTFSGNVNVPTPTLTTDATNKNYVDTQIDTREPTITILPIAKGGTGQSSANSAFNALAPSQATNANKILTTDGTNSSWESLLGTANQIAITQGSGVKTFSLPQNINTAATPIFAGVTLASAPIAASDATRKDYVDAQIANIPSTFFKSIQSSITFTNLDEILIVAAPALNAIGTYCLQLKSSNQELNIVFTINANSNSSYKYSTINIVEVTDTTGNITTSNISNFLLMRGFYRSGTPNSYFAISFSMPNQLIYTNPLTMRLVQFGFSYLNENTAVTSLITTDIANLINLATPELIFNMKVNVVPVTVSNPQGYVYFPASGSNAILQYSINPLTGALTALTPASLANTSPYKIAATKLRNYIYVVHASGTAMEILRVSPTGTLSSAGTATQPNTTTGIVVDPTDRFVYACGFGTGLFGQWVITKSTGLLTAIPGAPTAAAQMQDLCCHPSGKWLYAINASNGLIYQYSITQTPGASQGALVAMGTPTIAAGTTPIKIIAHPSGLFIAVLNNGANTISIYIPNTVTGELLAFSTFNVAPAFSGNMQGIAFHPNGNFIYYTSQTSGTLAVSPFNTGTGIIGSAIGSLSVAQARDCCFDYSGSYIYTVNNLNNRIDISTVNPTTGALTANGNIAAGANANNIIAI